MLDSACRCRDYPPSITVRFYIRQALLASYQNIGCKVQMFFREREGKNAIKMHASLISWWKIAKTIRQRSLSIVPFTWWWKKCCQHHFDIILCQERHAELLTFGWHKASIWIHLGSSSLSGMYGWNASVECTHTIDPWGLLRGISENIMYAIKNL
jgi:hypothetical protein